MSGIRSHIRIEDYVLTSFDEFKNDVINDLTIKGYSLPNLSPSFGNLLDQARLKYISLLSTGGLVFKETSFSFSWRCLSNMYLSKYTIGSENGLGQPYAQLLRTTYLPNTKKDFEQSDCPILQSSYILVQLRNLLSGIDRDFGYDPEQENFWNASRIHDYPCGGGFMMEHYDNAFPNILAESKIPFLQIYCSLSIKGQDFTQGGGYVIPIGSNVVFTDRDLVNKNRIALFDGKIKHGVKPIDPHIPFRFDELNARTALFASLYPVKN